MNTLYLLTENLTNGLVYDTLSMITILSILSGIFVIISKNPIVSVLFLIGLFLSIAGYLMMLGINFIGLSYLLVYVGAVSILFLFILMLINVRISELVTDNNNSLPMAIMIGILFSVTLYKLYPSEFISYLNSNYISLIQQGDIENLANSTSLSEITSYLSNKDIFYVDYLVWDGLIAEVSHITSIGNVIYTVYPIWLILTSIILLLAMVGAIVINIPNQNKESNSK